ncbi:MAG: methyltransferase domain-containing protein [Afipia sp.]|nr:methyltransferase domain-containing protein [Afipia sp.]
MNRKQRRAEGRGKGPSGPTSRGPSGYLEDQMLARALDHHQAGRLHEAELGYRDLLAINPDHAGGLSYLGLLAYQSGHSEAGIGLLEQGVDLDGQNPITRYNLALMLAEVGRDDEAILHNRKALELKPDYQEAHANLSALLLMRGRMKEALAAVIQGLQLAESQSLRSTFVLLAQSIDPATAESEGDFTKFLTRALTEPWSRPRDLSGIGTAVLMRDSAIARAIDRVSASDGTRQPDELFSSEELARIGREGLASAVFTTSPITAIAIERVLTAARRSLLDLVIACKEGDEAHQWLSFASTVALQCFINEYVFDSSDRENDLVSTLRARIESRLEKDKDIDPLKLALLACYVPLHSIAGADRLAAREWPEVLRPVIVQHILNRRIEQDIRAEIETLSPVRDAVSGKVREQYEENPYPRWTSVAAQVQPMPVDLYLRNRFPGAPYRDLGNGPVNILVAGCGTGMHAIQRARQFTHANVLAIDLSLSSLSFAIRKTRDLGLSNMRYAQADILEFKSDTPFDIVDSSGVLHHLKCPRAGWRQLADLVRPGGLMHIGLYSSIARADINAARESFAKDGQPFSHADIRRVRRQILNLSGEDRLSKVTQFSDFFSMSEFRDLLFHVQEHQFTIPELEEFIAKIGFTFVGFETPARSAYLKRFPGDPAATNLRNWHVFETENPATFAQMYQFWIQKS